MIRTAGSSQTAPIACRPGGGGGKGWLVPQTEKEKKTNKKMGSFACLAVSPVHSTKAGVDSYCGKRSWGGVSIFVGKPQKTVLYLFVIVVGFESGAIIERRLKGGRDGGRGCGRTQNRHLAISPVWAIRSYLSLLNEPDCSSRPKV